MTLPNPSPFASQPAQQVGNPSGPGAQLPPQPFAQNPFASQAQPTATLQQPMPHQPYVPPVRDAGPPKQPRPKLTKAAAHRARLAGGVGGGLAWLGLGITQLSAIFLLLPVLVGAVVYGIGFAIEQDGTSATADVWSQTLAWLGSPWGIVIAIGIPAGIVIALLGLWISARMLRHPGLRRPAGVTWAGFGISVVAAVLLSGAGSVTLPFFGGLPFGDGFDLDGSGFDSGVDPGTLDQEEAQQWLLEGGAGVLSQFADPGTLLGILGPWIAIGQLLALIVPIAVSVFAWWWMAHAMRPATDDAATDAEAANAPSASAA
ncbi:hypothetical protein [Agrococcus sp. ARC_14]|uniref:hypothetical protein n=1 Tax=Agrococcus sp. ARC_14 TaxID=2919927 RepID=UPI001F05113D|nr:hypothetical protein [Agrococcus sp. ARC_14]MCH1884022.1 hypothetical protein [Agrococcus sp. ARC_14]